MVNVLFPVFILCAKGEKQQSYKKESLNADHTTQSGQIGHTAKSTGNWD